MIVETSLNKGTLQKQNALRKSLENEIAKDTFSKWMKAQASRNVIKEDSVAIKVQEELSLLVHDKSFRLDSKGYIIKRSKGKGASKFVVRKIE
jgi:hypothetical protein